MPPSLGLFAIELNGINDSDDSTRIRNDDSTDKLNLNSFSLFVGDSQSLRAILLRFVLTIRTKSGGSVSNESFSQDPTLTIFDIFKWNRSSINA